MKKIIIILCLFLTFSTKANEPNATAFVEKFANAALSEILTKKISLKEKSKLFKDLFEKNVSMDTVASFALGRKIKTLSKEEIKEFKETFKQNMVLMWSLRFNEYKGQKIEFAGEKISENGKDIFVSSNIIDPDKPSEPPIDTVWRVRTGDKEGMKIIDIIISNISMLKTYQTEYTSFLNQNDGDINALINMLKTKNANYEKNIKDLDKNQSK